MIAMSGSGKCGSNSRTLRPTHDGGRIQFGLMGFQFIQWRQLPAGESRRTGAGRGRQHQGPAKRQPEAVRNYPAQPRLVVLVYPRRFAPWAGFLHQVLRKLARLADKIFRKVKTRAKSESRPGIAPGRDWFLSWLLFSLLCRSACAAACPLNSRKSSRNCFSLPIGPTAGVHRGSDELVAPRRRSAQG